MAGYAPGDDGLRSGPGAPLPYLVTAIDFRKSFRL
jgi:hypothetical protein